MFSVFDITPIYTFTVFLCFVIFYLSISFLALMHFYHVFIACSIYSFRYVYHIFISYMTFMVIYYTICYVLCPCTVHVLCSYTYFTYCIHVLFYHINFSYHFTFLYIFIYHVRSYNLMLQNLSSHNSAMLLISYHIFPHVIFKSFILCFMPVNTKEVDTGNHEGPKALYSLCETVVHEGPKALLSLCETMNYAR